LLAQPVALVDSLNHQHAVASLTEGDDPILALADRFWDRLVTGEPVDGVAAHGHAPQQDLHLLAWVAVEQQ